MNIQLIDICKSYGKKQVLKNINLTFENGVYGLLGPNGAGKTTLINIMVTALDSNSGQVLYNGRDIRERGSGYLNVLGFLPQSARFYKNYTAAEFLKYMAALKGFKGDIEKKTDELLEYVNLSDSKKQRIGTFSGGMRQRIGIAQALINDPEILILDEPTAGLDPIERIRFRNLISEVSGSRTVILATHIVPDIEYTANTVILLKNGEVCRNDSPAVLTEELEGKVWKLNVSDSEFEKYITDFSVSNIYREGNEYTLRIVGEKPPAENAVGVTANLEDVFLYCIGMSQ